MREDDRYMSANIFERVVYIMKIAQSSKTVGYDSDVPYLRIEVGAEAIDSANELYGWMINGNGFFEALAKVRGHRANREIISCYAYHDNNFVSQIDWESEMVLSFYYAGDKGVWLDENLPTLEELRKKIEEDIENVV